MPENLCADGALIAVLDTNVALDIFLFQDAGAKNLAAALRGEKLVALADAASLAEWRRVLGYPKLALSSQKAEELLRVYQTVARFVPGEGGGYPLPRCRDAKDQFLLELAARGGAAWLVSRDKEVLRLKNPARGKGAANRPTLPFAILSPDEAEARLLAPGVGRGAAAELPAAY
ncbi:MAG: putative toxin-antitoxin system toxin component, PIN family [Zoogloeaceae bacterium]|nr:putative toxin-antitoxin system toxin component, PIN family [Zoogloeaceae bacterium]